MLHNINIHYIPFNQCYHVYGSFKPLYLSFKPEKNEQEIGMTFVKAAIN